MGYTMTEFIDNRLDQYFGDRSLYNLTPFTVENLRDCILLEIIKNAYFESATKKSLRENRGSDADDQRMLESRWLSFAQCYRTLQYNHIKQSMGIEIQELLPDNMESMQEKLVGHQITEMQYFEIHTMAETPILKSIISKRICDVKKVSNEEFRLGMIEYENIIANLIAKLDGDDEDVIFATIALFTLEWKYNIELFYNCAVEAEKHKVTDVPISKLSTLCAELTIPLPYDHDPFSLPKMLHTESRFVIHRLDLVASMYSQPDEVWESVQKKLLYYFFVKYDISCEIIHKWSLPEYFVTHIPRSEWASFLKEHYNIQSIYKPKNWTNSRIRYMRKTFRAMLKNIPTPKL